MCCTGALGTELPIHANESAVCHQLLTAGWTSSTITEPRQFKCVQKSRITLVCLTSRVYIFWMMGFWSVAAEQKPAVGLVCHCPHLMHHFIAVTLPSIKGGLLCVCFLNKIFLLWNLLPHLSMISNHDPSPTSTAFLLELPVHHICSIPTQTVYKDQILSVCFRSWPANDFSYVLRLLSRNTFV